MGSLLCFAMASLDGYIEDPTGDFGWAEPDDEVHQFVNDLERPVGTQLYGRRMYEVMQVWETDNAFAADSPVMLDFAEVWVAADKIVYSRTLPDDGIVTSRTRLERTFDPEAVRRMVDDLPHPASISGPELAGHALRAGIVDELHLMLAPVVVGGGKRALPDDVRLDLELLEERRFAASGMVFLRYRIRR